MKHSEKHFKFKKNILTESDNIFLSLYSHYQFAKKAMEDHKINKHEIIPYPINLVSKSKKRKISPAYTLYGKNLYKTYPEINFNYVKSKIFYIKNNNYNQKIHFRKVLILNKSVIDSLNRIFDVNNTLPNQWIYLVNTLLEDENADILNRYFTIFYSKNMGNTAEILHNMLKELSKIIKEYTHYGRDYHKFHKNLDSYIYKYTK